MELSGILEKHPSMEKRIDNIEKSEKIASLMLKIKDSEGIKLLLGSLGVMIETINESLLWEDMDKPERDLLRLERSCWLWLSGQFDKQNQVLKKISNFKEKYG